MNFAITGAAGYVAPRHLTAIHATGNNLVAALDPHDSVGILDKYFPKCAFFTEFERFDRHLEKLKRKGNKIDYLSVCSPNYLHDAHCRLALRLGADVICEKPIVVSPWNLDQLEELERHTGHKVYTVLQLRLHPEIVKLKETLNTDDKHIVHLHYVTPRGAWYYTSWKNDIEKSGGIAFNIGIHFFDVLLWLFGAEVKTDVQYKAPNKMIGITEFENAEVHWNLSLDSNDLPDDAKFYRAMVVNGNAVRFDNVFADLHTVVYEHILSGKGFGIQDARPAIELVHKLR